MPEPDFNAVQLLMRHAFNHPMIGQEDLKGTCLLGANLASKPGAFTIFRVP